MKRHPIINNGRRQQWIAGGGVEGGTMMANNER